MAEHALHAVVPAQSYAFDPRKGARMETCARCGSEHRAATLVHARDGAGNREKICRRCARAA
jgi:superfamily II helicase